VLRENDSTFAVSNLPIGACRMIWCFAMMVRQSASLRTRPRINLKICKVFSLPTSFLWRPASVQITPGIAHAANAIGIFLSRAL
jgi:hypothetical protein